MKLGKARPTNQNTSVISEFKGYNHNYRIADGEFYEMKNMSAEFYPLMSNRARRGFIKTLTNCQGISASDKLYWVDNGKFYYDSHEICDVSATDKQFVEMGAYICIFPDKIAYNTYTDDVIDLEHENVSEAYPSLTLCKMDGTVYTNDDLYVGDAEPVDRTKTWLDTSSEPPVLKFYSENTSQWVVIATTYVKIYSPGIGEDFKEDDAVTISGCDVEDFNTTMIVQACSDDYIVVIGLLDVGTMINSQQMTFKRAVPDMDYVCELNNRLWGCSSANHEIYGSKQGDPTNWNYYGGLASDSYAATVGTFGDFTGCIGYRGYVLFFKETGVHRLYGTMPSNFSMSWTELRGVQKGSEKSLVNLNETLFYKAEEGVMVYEGSMPINISEYFGKDKYYDAVAGQVNEKYYISMRDKDYNWNLFCFDTDKKLWHKEDERHIYGFGFYSGRCYMVDEEQKMWVFPIESMVSYLFPDMKDEDDEYYYPDEKTADGEYYYPGFIVEGHYEDDVEWFVETGDMGLENPFNKYVVRLVLRMMLDEGTTLKIQIQYDSNGVWDDLFEMVNDFKRSINVPLRVNRCDHYRLRISGKGDAKIYSITQATETGSEL